MQRLQIVLLQVTTMDYAFSFLKMYFFDSLSAPPCGGGALRFWGDGRRPLRAVLPDPSVFTK